MDSHDASTTKTNVYGSPKDASQRSAQNEFRPIARRNPTLAFGVTWSLSTSMATVRCPELISLVQVRTEETHSAILRVHPSSTGCQHA